MERPRPVPLSFRYLTRFISYCLGETTPLLNVPVLFIEREPIHVEDTVLYHSRYFPESMKDEAMPCILIRTPYPGPVPHLSALRLASQGFCVIVQQCRGRDDASSLDDFIPIQSEKKDGIATLNWIAKQSFCNGNIGMFGQSYLGICQWAVVDEAPPELKAIVPINCSSNLFPVLSPSGGIVPLDLIIRWIYLVYVSGAQNVGALRRILRRLKLPKVAYSVSNHLPLISLDERVVGRPLSFYRGAIQYLHDSEHEFWQTEMPVSVCQNITKAPASLLIAGWFDLFLNGQIADWMRLQSTSSLHQLIIGPWHHWQFKSMAPVVESAALSWLRTHLCGTGESSANRVRLFISGIEDWEDYSSFPPPAEHRRFYLRSDESIRDRPLYQEGSFSFVYDPMNPTPHVGGASFDNKNAGRLRQNEFEKRSDVLVFTSEPLQYDLKVVGLISADLWVSSSAMSSDWVVRICDVDENGISTNLTDGITRLLKDGHEQCHVLVKMGAIGHVFKSGHSIRIQVCGGAFPRFSRNSGTGEDGPLDADAYMIATNSMYFSRDMIPHVTLPCIELGDEIEVNI